MLTHQMALLQKESRASIIPSLSNLLAMGDLPSQSDEGMDEYRWVQAYERNYRSKGRARQHVNWTRGALP